MFDVETFVKFCENILPGVCKYILEIDYLRGMDTFYEGEKSDRTV